MLVIYYIPQFGQWYLTLALQTCLLQFEQFIGVLSQLDEQNLHLARVQFWLPSLELGVDGLPVCILLTMAADCSFRGSIFLASM